MFLHLSVCPFVCKFFLGFQLSRPCSGMKNKIIYRAAWQLMKHCRPKFELTTVVMKSMPTNSMSISCYIKHLLKLKPVPLQAWSGPECSRNLRVPDLMKTAQDGGEVASLTHRPPLPLGNVPGTDFC